MATVNLRHVPDDLHDALRIEAAGRRSSIKALLIQAAEEWLRREAKYAQRLRARPAAVSRRKGGRA
ncbi:MAG: hypothetical protein L0191_02110 [Acidobacteria bacterium]|nr:hypothetical protein [Acidobacteriota bacterium]